MMLSQSRSCRKRQPAFAEVENKAAIVFTQHHVSEQQDLAAGMVAPFWNGGSGLPLEILARCCGSCLFVSRRTNLSCPIFSKGRVFKGRRDCFGPVTEGASSYLQRRKLTGLSSYLRRVFKSCLAFRIDSRTRNVCERKSRPVRIRGRGIRQSHFREFGRLRP